MYMGSSVGFMPGMEAGDVEVEVEVEVGVGVGVGGVPLPFGVGKWEEPALPQAARASRPATVGAGARKRRRSIERMRMETFR